MNEEDDKSGKLFKADLQVDRWLERLHDVRALTKIIHNYREMGARSSEIARAIVKFVAGTSYSEHFEDSVAACKRGDYAIAISLMKPLAEKGDANAQLHLGIMYEISQGGPQDYSEAVKWYRRAAEGGNALAQYNLGLMYAIGQGVTEDYVMSHMWLKLAVSRFPASEGMRKEKAAKIIDSVASKMTTAQIAEAQRLAREWTPKKEVR